MRIIPNRIIKESIRESKAISSLTDAQFRLWLYLITYVDDYGRGKADPELLASILFPRIKSFSEKQVKDCMDGLERKGLIVRYVADQEPYFFFPNWAKHQRIQTKKSKFPPPPDDLVIHGESRWNSVSDGNSHSESNPIQSNPNPNPNTESESKQRGTFVPPSLAEVEEYVRENDYNVDPKQFFDYYTEMGWKDANGNKVKNWKGKLITWHKKTPGRVSWKRGEPYRLSDGTETNNPFLQYIDKELANGQDRNSKDTSLP